MNVELVEFVISGVGVFDHAYSDIAFFDVRPFSVNIHIERCKVGRTAESKRADDVRTRSVEVGSGSNGGIKNLTSIVSGDEIVVDFNAIDNGRMARLWQTALLSRWNPLFQYIPIESQIERFQNAYYDTIALSTSEGQSTPFVKFLLTRIEETLDRVIAQEGSDSVQTEQVRRLLSVMEYDTPYTATALMRLLGLKSRDALRNNYLAPAIDAGLVQMTEPDKPTSRNQRYQKT